MATEYANPKISIEPSNPVDLKTCHDFLQLMFRGEKQKAATRNFHKTYQLDFNQFIEVIWQYPTWKEMNPELAMDLILFGVNIARASCDSQVRYAIGVRRKQQVEQQMSLFTNDNPEPIKRRGRPKKTQLRVV